jgi:hypothetical protein
MDETSQGSRGKGTWSTIPHLVLSCLLSAIFLFTPTCTETCQPWPMPSWIWLISMCSFFFPLMAVLYAARLPVQGSTSHFSASGDAKRHQAWRMAPNKVLPMHGLMIYMIVDLLLQLHPLSTAPRQRLPTPVTSHFCDITFLHQGGFQHGGCAWPGRCGCRL